MEFFNYYEILSVKETAEPGAIKSAFQSMAMKYHPDRVAEHLKKKSEDIFKTISEAYEVLSDPEKRKKYDEWLKKTKPDQTANRASASGPPVANVDRDYFKFENLRPGVPASDILTVLNQGGETLIGTIGSNKPWTRLSETVINASEY
jgi:DnaJ-class molecular chaperone